jgi:hypothetical protein
LTGSFICAIEKPIWLEARKPSIEMAAIVELQREADHAADHGLLEHGDHAGQRERIRHGGMFFVSGSIRKASTTDSSARTGIGTMPSPIAGAVDNSAMMRQNGHHRAPINGSRKLTTSI